MKVLPISQLKDKEETIKENAKKLDLDIIDYNILYSLEKIGAKKESKSIPSSGYIIDGAAIYLIGDNTYVWFYLENPINWFKTSPIVSIKKTDSGCEFETQNSFYRLTPVVIELKKKKAKKNA